MSSSSSKDNVGSSSSSSSSGSMTSLSHSPTDTPERRAAERAASRAWGRRPLKFHGPPDFILTTKNASEEQEVASRAGLRWTNDTDGTVLFPQLPTFPEYG